MAPRYVKADDLKTRLYGFGFVVKSDLFLRPATALDIEAVGVIWRNRMAEGKYGPQANELSRTVCPGRQCEFIGLVSL